MTRIKLNDYDDVFRVDITGHATGSVEACAGISTLTFALCTYLLDTEAIEIIELTLDEKTANAHFAFKGGKEAETAFELVSCGLKSLAETCPGCVNLV